VANFSPGPWCIVYNARALVESTVTLQTVALAILSGTYAERGMTLDEAQQEYYANATLMAAAPEMLDALIEARMTTYQYEQSLLAQGNTQAVKIYTERYNKLCELIKRAAPDA